MNSQKSTALAIVGIIFIVAALLLIPSLFYVVDQRQMAVVLQFGRPVVEHTEPGIYLKVPLIQNVRKIPSTKQFWGNNPGSPLSDLPTKDDKKIEIVPWAVWRVKQPKVFVQTLVTMDEAERRVSEFVRGAIRDVVTQYDLAELVRSSDRPLTTTGSLGVDVEAATDLGEPAEEAKPGEKKKVQIEIQFGREEILAKIKEEAQRRLASKSEGGEGRGIELVDMGISQIDFVESVQAKTFDRWIAERQAIAALNVNEGERMKQEIINEAKAEVQKIEGQGQKQANETRGNVDAEIIRKYAAAIETAGEFYNFIRTLEVYQKALGGDTRLILTTDSDLLRLLKGLEPAGALPGSAKEPTSPPPAKEPGSDVTRANGLPADS